MDDGTSFDEWSLKFMHRGNDVFHAQQYNVFH